MICSTCRFFVPCTVVRGEGACRRFPPLIVPIQDWVQNSDGHVWTTAAEWPVVRDGYWCGEHVERAKEP